MAAPRPYRLGVIPGDGIGPEIVASAIEVLEAVAKRDGFSYDLTELAGGAATYQRIGTPLSPEDLERVRDADATLKGPVGLPEVRLPDGTEAGLLGGLLRMGLDLFANVRPVLAFPGIVGPLRADPGSIDYVIVRENTEGLYASRGKGVGNDYAVTDTLLVTRHGTERVCRYAFELARKRQGAPSDGISRVTCVDKANVLRSTYFFRQIFFEIASEFPEIEAECRYVDAAAQALVLEPEHFDVIVTENLFGDVLSDLGGATVGGISLCASGNIGEACAYFEPIHGSAPDLKGTGHANPIGQILSLAMLLTHIGEIEAGLSVRGAVMDALARGELVVERSGAVVGGATRVTSVVVAGLAR
jgi:isocitrate/isopropylmalate dehydrogenase